MKSFIKVCTITCSMVLGSFLFVNANTGFQLTSGVAGKTFKVGDTMYITWDVSSQNVSQIVIELSPNKGLSWIQIHKEENISLNSPFWKKYPFIIPDSLEDDEGRKISIVKDSCKIQIYDYQNLFEPQSSGYFSIKSGLPIINMQNKKQNRNKNHSYFLTNSLSDQVKGNYSISGRFHSKYLKKQPNRLSISK